MTAVLAIAYAALFIRVCWVDARRYAFLLLFLGSQVITTGVLLFASFPQYATWWSWDRWIAGTLWMLATAEQVWRACEQLPHVKKFAAFLARFAPAVAVLAAITTLPISWGLLDWNHGVRAATLYGRAVAAGTSVFLIVTMMVLRFAGESPRRNVTVSSLVMIARSAVFVVVSFLVPVDRYRYSGPINQAYLIAITMLLLIWALLFRRSGERAREGRQSTLNRAEVAELEWRLRERLL